ncbi:MAG TPA: hypothetical protein VEH84_11475 [Alphaproteobacteria bacterium]|nr:hypothetical protein [Alphaproteobacteria bacterium]
MTFESDQDGTPLPEPTIDRSEWAGIARRHRAGENIGRIAQSFKVEPAEIMAILRQNPLTMRADSMGRRAAAATPGAPEAKPGMTPADHAAALEQTLASLGEAVKQPDSPELRPLLDAAWQRLRDIEALTAGGKAGRR